jgi:hypothetical protein
MSAGIAPNAATAVGFSNRPQPRRMRLVSFKPLVKGARRGFANIELPNGLRITDCPVLVGGNGKAWATLPSKYKPVLGADGRQIIVEGKRQYCPLIEWKDRDLSDRFSATVVALVLQHHPDALKNEAAA